MSLRLITNADLDAYEAEQTARLQAAQDAHEVGLRLMTRYEIALGLGDELDLRRAEALIANHDLVHGTQLLNELAAA